MEVEVGVEKNVHLRVGDAMSGEWRDQSWMGE